MPPAVVHVITSTMNTIHASRTDGIACIQLITMAARFAACLVLAPSSPSRGRYRDVELGTYKNFAAEEWTHELIWDLCRQLRTRR